VPLHFPEFEEVPESDTHLELRMLLYESVRLALGEQGLVSSEQFLYWDPTDPKRCLSPDLGIRVGGRRERIRSWKCWERGSPEVGVEIVSPSDTGELPLERKLERYRLAGVREVVHFDPETEPGLRLWDLIEGDLVERDLTDAEALRCDALGLYWCVQKDPQLGRTLRLARDAAGTDVLPTPAEAERTRAEAERTRAEAERARAEATEARLAELTARLEQTQHEP
jgi:Uma2 family endonuclease